MNTTNESKSISIECLIERLGGADLLRSRYPELYKAYLNSLERERLAGSTNANFVGFPDGAIDSYKVRTLNFSPGSTLSTTSSIETKEIKPTLAIIGQLEDARTGKYLDGFSVYDNNVKEITGSSSVLSSSLASDSTRRYIASSTFTALDTVDGKSYLSGYESSIDACKMLESKPIVESMEVTAPMPIKHPDAQHTIVCYNRSWTCADYSYSNVDIGNNGIEVRMPVAGKVVFASGFTPLPSSPIVREKLVLQLEHLKESCAEFNLQECWDKIKFSVSGNTLRWEFPDEWKTYIKKSNISSGTIVDFYFRMTVKMSNEIEVPLVIQSQGDEHPDPAYKKIKDIQLLWGCFAKDTRIRMADGSCKAVYDIRAGDAVYTRESGVQIVKSVITGNEERVIYIESSHGDKLRVSDGHPVLTTEGLVKAKELTAGSILITENGNSSISSLYYEDYHDTVYNFEFENESVLLANGIYAGDFAAQNRCASVRQTASAKCSDVQEELNALMETIHHQQIERRN